MTVHSYLRISTLDKGQTVENQRKAIKDAGYATDEWYAEEGVSGSVKALERPEFSRMMARCARNDLVIVTALDRLGRDAEDILHTVNNFERMGVRVCILALGNTDVTSVMGKAFVIMLSALAEMERNTLRERTRQGLARTKEEGVFVGRPLAIHPNQMEALVRGESVVGINRQTAYRNIKKWGDNLVGYKQEWDKRQAQYVERQAA
ncbi:MAG: recombinase family protein [Halobacteriota archaeon]